MVKEFDARISGPQPIEERRRRTDDGNSIAWLDDVLEQARGQVAPRDQREVDAAQARTDSVQARTPPRIEFSASDINQLIAANRNSRGKAFVSIENNVGHVQVSIPLEKVGFPGRYLNGNFDVTASPDGDPWRIHVTKTSLSGVDVPEKMLNLLVGAGSLRSYIDQYAGEYDVSKVYIIDNKAVLETGTAR